MSEQGDPPPVHVDLIGQLTLADTMLCESLKRHVRMHGFESHLRDAMTTAQVVHLLRAKCPWPVSRHHYGYAMWLDDMDTAVQRRNAIVHAAAQDRCVLWVATDFTHRGEPVDRGAEQIRSVTADLDRFRAVAQRSITGLGVPDDSDEFVFHYCIDCSDPSAGRSILVQPPPLVAGFADASVAGIGIGFIAGPEPSGYQHMEDAEPRSADESRKSMEWRERLAHVGRAWWPLLVWTVIMMFNNTTTLEWIVWTATAVATVVGYSLAVTGRLTGQRESGAILIALAGLVLVPILHMSRWTHPSPAGRAAMSRLSLTRCGPYRLLAHLAGRRRPRSPRWRLAIDLKQTDQSADGASASLLWTDRGADHSPSSVAARRPRCARRGDVGSRRAGTEPGGPGRPAPSRRLAPDTAHVCHR